MLVRVWDKEEKLWIIEELIRESGRCDKCSVHQDKLFAIDGEPGRIIFCGFCMIETYGKVEVIEE